jgi:carboxypeptidase PM20D1
MSCTPRQAERLGEAIRFRTVTIISRTPEAEPGYASFAGFLEFLRRSFPRAAAALQWEQLGELALLLTWSPPTKPPVAAQKEPGVAPQEPALLFYAHFDVVPPGDEQAWTHGAFSGDIADGFIWGRGALDDKNCLMGLMEAVESLLEKGKQPAVPVYLAFGGDEETTGSFGARVIAEALAARGVRLCCVLDEGSFISDGILPFMERPIAMVGLAEKGFANAEVIVRGKAGHSSMPGRGTAAGALAAVITAVERHRFPPRLTGTVVLFFRSIAPHVRGLTGLALRLIRLLWPFLRSPLSRTPTVDALLRTTQAVTILRAGEKENVIPDAARAVVNLRLLPGDSSASALLHVGHVARRALPAPFSLEVRLLPGATASDPVPESRPSPALWDALRAAIHEVEPRAVIAPFLVVVYTDSRKFASISESIVRFHPVALTAEEIGRVHSADERISLENYGRMITFYERMLCADARRTST